jgi:tRNA(fMet)-specific endonuclease VapC
VRFLVDTNIVSHAMRGEAKVIDRLKRTQRDRLFMSVVSLAEIEYGIARLPRGPGGPSKRSEELRELFESLQTYVDVAAWDRPAAKRYAVIRAESEASGLAIDQADMMIAAHASSMEATLVTADRTLLRRPKAPWMPTTVNWLA